MTQPASPQAKHETAHTPEPWVVGAVNSNTIPADPYNRRMRCIEGADGQGFAWTVGLSAPTDAANAARIVACVNACAGLDPAAIPALIAAAERAAVTASCHTCEGTMVCGGCQEDDRIRKDLRAALAACRGTK